MFLKELDKENAQKIADGIMNIVPYNINIMDRRGYIIASGDKSRLNTLHMGAVNALERLESYVVYEDTKTERKGVNIPIFYNNQIMGVIGVSGNPDEVMQTGKMVVVMARLMIENQIINDMTSIKESRLKDFLYDWMYLKADDYNEEFRDRAKYFNIDVSLPRTAVIISSRRVRFSVFEQIRLQLESSEYVVRQGMEETLILFNENENLQKRLEWILSLSKDFLKCYVGVKSVVVSDSVFWAMQTYRIAGILNLDKHIVRFDEIGLEHNLSKIPPSDSIERLKKALCQSDYSTEMIDTIFAYARCNYDHRLVCQQLHIHRNTLNYRLSRIEEITGKDPRRMRDLMELYIAVIQIKSSS